MIHIVKNLAAAVAVTLSFSAAEASTVNVSGSGFFGLDTPVTAESAPGQTFAFSFITDEPIPGNPDYALVNPMFTLSGSLITPTIASVNFGNDSNNGLFDLVFSDKNTLSFYGATINVGGYLQPGAYSADVALGGGDPIGVGLVSVSVSVSPVPLPASAPMFGGAILALAVTGVFVKRRRGLQTAA